MKQDDDNHFNIILIIIIVISITWSLYCRLRVLEYVANRH
jgi:hypothetical protein